MLSVKYDIRMKRLTKHLQVLMPILILIVFLSTCPWIIVPCLYQRLTKTMIHQTHGETHLNLIIKGVYPFLVNVHDNGGLNIFVYVYMICFRIYFRLPYL